MALAVSRHDPGLLTGITPSLELHPVFSRGENDPGGASPFIGTLY